MTIHQLYLYPVKSLGPVAVTEAVVETRGFRHDRRFMLVTPPETAAAMPEGQMMTQRDYPGMALFDVAFGEGETLRIAHRTAPHQSLTVPLVPTEPGEAVRVTVWDSAPFTARAVGEEADRWFTQWLQTPCRLVYMPGDTERRISSPYRRPDDEMLDPVVSFADGFPYLVTSLESLAELNSRLPTPVTMSRFRPNLVVSGVAGPHEEDSWAHFRAGGLDFYGVKPCARCVMVTIDPETAVKETEPLRTLATYRRSDAKVLFGQNVMSPAEGTLRIGDQVEVVKRMETWI